MTTPANIHSLTFRLATFDEIYHLRYTILRANHPVERIVWPGDDATPPVTFHFAAFDQSAAPPTTIACLTVHSSHSPLDPFIPAYCLRGMAVAPTFRVQKIGSQLLSLATSHILTHTSIRLLWCNARVPAINFYLRHNWQIISEEFEIEDAGPHKKMLRPL